MTLKELANMLDRSEKTIYKQWKRTQKAFAKKGIIITRWGKGENIEYEVEFEEMEEDE